MRVSLERKILLGFAIALTVLLLSGFLAWVSAERFNRAARDVAHTHEVLYQLQATLSDVLNMQTATRGYLLTQNEDFLKPYRAGRENLLIAGEALRRLTADNPLQQTNLDQLQTNIEELDALMDRFITMNRRGRFSALNEQGALVHGDELMGRLRLKIAAMEHLEESLLGARTEIAQAQSRQTTFVIVSVSILAAIIVATAGLLVSRDFARRAEADRRIKQLNAELEANIDRLETTNHELEAFSYSVSHDLRAPLRHITGFASLLEKRAGLSLDAQSKHYVSTIIQAGVRMGQLIDDLLAFSRTGRSSLRPVPLDHADLVARVISEIKSDPMPEWKVVPLPITSADNAMLRQVWFNLLDNAAKYSRKNAHPIVEVGHREDEAHDEHVFWVRDNGVGFDMAYADKLFGVFSRLHSVDEFEGTGIGLALVRRIVTRHGGRTWAEGKLGEGATFYFSLPRKPATLPET